MDSKKFIVDFSDECIVQHSNNIKVFRFKPMRRKRTTVTISPPEPSINLVKRSIVMEEVNFFLDIFGDEF